MGIYSKSQEMVDQVVKELAVFKDLIDKRDEEKEEQYGFIPGMNMKNETELVEEQIHKLREGIFQVLFTGGFSSGKSTVLNALMRKDLLKTGINPETAVVTKLVFNADEKVIVYKKNVDQITGKQITEEMTVEKFFEKYRVSQENADMFIDIDYVQLQQSQDGVGGSMVQLVDSPGTSNSVADTEAARNFAEKASAIVYLINAVMPFIDDDKEYIKSHFAGRNMKNLFFVINRFDCVQPGEVDALKANVEKQLREVFTKKDGSFDRDLFESRVFYTNAFGSLNTRTNKKTPIQGVGEIMIPDENTGVPDFEDALGKFLTDDNRDRDALSAYIPKLAKIYVEAENKINDEIAAYDKSLEDLEKEKAEFDASIEKTEKIIENIENTCRTTAQNILLDIKLAYDNFVNDVEFGWDDHFKNVNIKFSAIDLIKTALEKNEEKKAEKVKPIHDAISNYTDEKVKTLEENIGSIIETKVKTFEDQLITFQEQLEAIDSPVKLEDIMSKLTGGTQVDVNGGQEIKMNTFQFVLGIIGLDLDIIGGAANGASNKSAVIKSITGNIVEYIALNVVGWPIGLAMMGVRIWKMVSEFRVVGEKAAKTLIEKLKPDTIGALRSGKDAMVMDLEKDIAGSFIKAGNTFATNFRNKLEEQKESYEATIKNLQDENFSLEVEKERADKLLDKMVQVISNINKIVLGEELNIHGVKAQAFSYEKRQEQK